MALDLRLLCLDLLLECLVSRGRVLLHLQDGVLELLDRLLKTVNLTAEGLDLGRVAGLGADAWRGQKDGGGRD